MRSLGLNCGVCWFGLCVALGVFWFSMLGSGFLWVFGYGFVCVRGIAVAFLWFLVL